MGSYWAYYELGWGGWWFWDPVENASLMPWIAGTALLHSALVMEKRDGTQGLDHPSCHPVLLAVADRLVPGALGRADLGAFLRHRSDARRLHPGDPASLHRRRAGALRLARAGAAQGGLFAPISREGALVLNNLF
jgi:cytochrome c-type biogenesis protein CcmF